jgi:hypothetical protein
MSRAFAVRLVPYTAQADPEILPWNDAGRVGAFGKPGDGGGVDGGRAGEGAERLSWGTVVADWHAERIGDDCTDLRYDQAGFGAVGGATRATE